MINYKVTPVDGGEPFDLRATSRDVLVWEKTTKGKTFADLMNNLAMVDLYKIAHFAAKREAKFDGSLSEWERAVDLTPEIEEDQEPDPTPPGA